MYTYLIINMTQLLCDVTGYCDANLRYFAFLIDISLNWEI